MRKRFVLGMAALTLLLVTTETANAQSWTVGSGWGGPVVGASWGTRVGNRGFVSVGGFTSPTWVAAPAPVFAPAPVVVSQPVVVSPPVVVSRPAFVSSPGVSFTYVSGPRWRGGWRRGWGW